MAYRKSLPSGTIAKLEKRLKEAKSAEDLRRVQTVYYRARFDYPPAQIAEMTGYAVGTVHNIHSDYLEHGDKIFDSSRPGGRRAALMSVSEEAAFLAPFIAEGDAGGILEVSRIHEALCARMGRRVAIGTAYNILHRHGWRKIMPRARHPKADKEAQADFKKMA
jgi:transposase